MRSGVDLFYTIYSKNLFLFLYKLKFIQLRLEFTVLFLGEYQLK